MFIKLKQILQKCVFSILAIGIFFRELFTLTIQARRTRHAGHCWRSKDELVSDVLLWTPAYGQSKARRPARTFIQQLCDDTGCYLEDLPEAMNDRETWRERVRDIRTCRTTWWWWWWWYPVYIKHQVTARFFLTNEGHRVVYDHNFIVIIILL